MQNFSPQSTNRVFVAVTLLLSFPYVVEIHSSTISTIFVITWQLIDCKMGVFSTLFHTSPHSPFMAFSWHFVAFGYRQALRRCSGPSGFPCPQRAQRAQRSVLPVAYIAGIMPIKYASVHFIRYSSFYPFRTLWTYLGHFARLVRLVRYRALWTYQDVQYVQYASILLPCSFLYRCRAFLARFSLQQGNYSGRFINGPKKGIRQPFLYKNAILYKYSSSKRPILIPISLVGI